MKKLSIEKYILKRRLFNKDQISFSLKAKEAKKNNALNYGNRLLYIVKNKEDFLYVGEAKSALKTRIARGFTSFRHFKRFGKKRGGYGGYKWIALFDEEQTSPVMNELNITVVLFDDSYNDGRHKLEAVEGELVFLIREKRGNWPLYQNEIHFNNDFEESREIASDILKFIQ